MQSLLQRAPVWVLHPALAPSLGSSVPQHCSAVSQPAASALLTWGQVREGHWVDQVGLAPCADVQPPSVLCHAFSLWRLNCFFQVVFPCSASISSISMLP